MSDLIKRNSPPGVDTSQLKRIFIFGSVTSFIIGIMVFLIKYVSQYNNLFMYDQSGKAVLIKDAVISRFPIIIGNSMIGFAITAICCLCFIPYYILYYRQGSMSIYLMKRLPQRSELYRSILVVPIMFAIFAMLFAIISTAICLALYITVTPRACLPENIFVPQEVCLGIKLMLS